MSEDSLLAKLDEYIKCIIHEEGYISYKINIRRISPNGGGYMGILFEVDINGNTAVNEKETNVFLKVIVPTASRMKIYSVFDVYKRESFAYKEVSKVFNDLQNEYNVPNEKRFQMGKSFEACNPEAVIPENISKKGYKTYNRMDVVGLKYAELSIEHLARFHGISIVLKEKRPEYFESKIKVLQQPFNFGKDWSDYVNNIMESSMAYLDQDLINKYGEKIKQIAYKYPEYMMDTSSIQTLCHGDYKHGNIMAFEKNGVPTQVLSVDYQLLHCGCPILDLLYFIFNGTDQQFRNAHLIHLNNLYYEALKDFLNNFNLDINHLFPRETFERLFKQKLDFGLMINVFYIPFLFACEDDVPDVTESLKDIKFNIDPRFGDRFRGVVYDFINWGYL